jgi:hypothetical protein
VYIYKTALIVWGNARQAFIAAFLYATAFSVAYVTLTEYTAFASMLFVMCLYYTISRKEKTLGYVNGVLGFFTKLYPAIAFPFIVLYNSKVTSLKTEIISFSKVFGIASLILFVPVYLLNNSAIDTYLIRINGQQRGLFASATPYMIHSWINKVFGIQITASNVAMICYAILGIVILAALYVAYASKKQDPQLLIKLIVVSLFAVVSAMQFNSPNYGSWGYCLLAILAIKDIKTIVAFYLTQVMAFLVFPLGFYTLWTHPDYTGATGSPLWWIALLIFTAQFVILFYVVWSSVDPIKIYKTLKSEGDS